MKVILDELNSKEFFSNGGVVKLRVKTQEFIGLCADRNKITFFDNKSYVRFMRELYLKYIAKHNELSQGDAYERVNDNLEVTSFIGDKRYVLDPAYDNKKSLEMCLFYYYGDSEVFDYKGNAQGKDPFGIKNVNFSLIDEDDDRWEYFQRQRIERGFDESELWSLDSTIANFILPRLKAFREESVGTPADLPLDRWYEILDSMIEGFEIITNDNPHKSESDTEKEDRALDLFRKYFYNLWY